MMGVALPAGSMMALRMLAMMQPLSSLERGRQCPSQFMWSIMAIIQMCIQQIPACMSGLHKDEPVHDTSIKQDSGLCELLQPKEMYFRIIIKPCQHSTDMKWHANYILFDCLYGLSQLFGFVYMASALQTGRAMWLRVLSCFSGGGILSFSFMDMFLLGITLKSCQLKQTKHFQNIASFKQWLITQPATVLKQQSTLSIQVAASYISQYCQL